MRKGFLTIAAIVLLFGLGGTVKAQIRIAGVGANFGNAAAGAIIASGDLAGTFTTLDTDTFNSMSVAALRSSFDVLIFTWVSDPAINADWTTRLLPYMALGGGIIFEDPGNLSDLAPGVLGGGGASVSNMIVSFVPGLTEGIGTGFVNAHMHFTSWDPRLQPFLVANGNTLGLWGQFPGGGRIIITGPDNHFHADKAGSSSRINQYFLLINEIRFVTGQFDACLQDFSTHSILHFSGLTGGFQLLACPSGAVTNGFGTVTQNGCNFFLKVTGGGQFVFGFYSGCQHIGKAGASFPGLPSMGLVTDSTHNGTCVCP